MYLLKETVQQLLCKCPDWSLTESKNATFFRHLFATSTGDSKKHCWNFPCTEYVLDVGVDSKLEVDLYPFDWKRSYPHPTRRRWQRARWRHALWLHKGYVCGMHTELHQLGKEKKMATYIKLSRGSSPNYSDRYWVTWARSHQSFHNWE
jgi:hypothetical protein